MNEQEKLCSIALTRICYFSLSNILLLYKRLGSATAIVEHRYDIRDVLPDASPKLVESLQALDEPLHRAEVELEYDEKHHIEVLTLSDDNYPQRLRACDDAPLVLFYRGSADLNQAHIIDIVGTRRCTTYGQDLVRRFMNGLRELCPHTLVVSGLAYGIDICAHRNALQCGMETVGVLAHGLDTIYPSRHRQTAIEMLTHGGLLTEFMTGTNADKVNFVRRNRIVAGVSDATILIESAAHGGGLITCGIANSYGREVFAFPGAVGAEYSEGCNHLIRDNAAGLITDAADFVKAMGWEDEKQLSQSRKEGIERQLFPNLSPEEQQIVKTLQTNNDLQINMLSVQSEIPVSRLTALLFSLEMKGVVKTLAGGVYHLLR